MGRPTRAPLPLLETVVGQRQWEWWAQQRCGGLTLRITARAVADADGGMSAKAASSSPAELQAAQACAIAVAAASQGRQAASTPPLGLHGLSNTHPQCRVAVAGRQGSRAQRGVRAWPVVVAVGVTARGRTVLVVLAGAAVRGAEGR